MSTQIAVRLPDEQVAFLDGEVAAGRASSRAELINRVLVRERRRQQALKDIEVMRAAGQRGADDLLPTLDATSDRPLGLE